MRIAIYGRTIDARATEQVKNLIGLLEKSSAQLVVEEKYLGLLKKVTNFTTPPSIFSNNHLERGTADYLLSIGGDGTILDTVAIVKDSGIPVLGLNTGRLGFLSSIPHNSMEEAIKNLAEKKFIINERTLIKASTQKQYFAPVDYALNELSVYRKKPQSLIVIRVWVDNVFLNAYWADGLIVSTPTGSTGYSLSCGGPIVYPQADTFIITPIATHNLTVRPLVIPNTKTIKIVVDARYGDYLAGLDARYAEIESGEAIIISKEKFNFNLIQFEEEEFFSTIREKLKWGLDTRN